MMMSEIRKVLLEAIRRIKEHGWIQHHARTCDGYCAWGAIHTQWEKNEDRESNMAAVEHVRSHLQKHYGGLSIAKWNDEKGRTKDEVLEMLIGAVNSL